MLTEHVVCTFNIYVMTCLLTAIGLTPGGSSTVHICTQTMHRTTQSTQTIHRTQLTNQEDCGPCPVFARYTLGIYLTTEEKAWKTLSQGSRRMSVGKEYSKWISYSIRDFKNGAQLSWYSEGTGRVIEVMLYMCIQVVPNSSVS